MCVYVYSLMIIEQKNFHPLVDSSDKIIWQKQGAANSIESNDDDDNDLLFAVANN